MRELYRSFAGPVPRKGFREMLYGLHTGIDAYMAFERREVYEVAPSPECRHLIAYLLLGLRKRLFDDGIDLPETGLQGLILCSDVFAYRIGCCSRNPLAFL